MNNQVKKDSLIEFSPLLESYIDESKTDFFTLKKEGDYENKALILSNTYSWRIEDDLTLCPRKNGVSIPVNKLSRIYFSSNALLDICKEGEFKDNGFRLSSVAKHDFYLFRACRIKEGKFPS